MQFQFEKIREADGVEDSTVIQFDSKNHFIASFGCDIRIFYENHIVHFFKAKFNVQKILSYKEYFYLIGKESYSLYKNRDLILQSKFNVPFEKTPFDKIYKVLLFKNCIAFIHDDRKFTIGLITNHKIEFNKLLTDSHFFDVLSADVLDDKLHLLLSTFTKRYILIYSIEGVSCLKPSRREIQNGNILVKRQEDFLLFDEEGMWQYGTKITFLKEFANYKITCSISEKTRTIIFCLNGEVIIINNDNSHYTAGTLPCAVFSVSKIDIFLFCTSKDFSFFIKISKYIDYLERLGTNKINNTTLSITSRNTENRHFNPTNLEITSLQTITTAKYLIQPEIKNESLLYSTYLKLISNQLQSISTDEFLFRGCIPFENEWIFNFNKFSLYRGFVLPSVISAYQFDQWTFMFFFDFLLCFSGTSMKSYKIKSNLVKFFDGFAVTSFDRKLEIIDLRQFKSIKFDAINEICDFTIKSNHVFCLDYNEKLQVFNFRNLSFQDIIFEDVTTANGNKTHKSDSNNISTIPCYPDSNNSSIIPVYPDFSVFETAVPYKIKEVAEEIHKIEKEFLISINLKYKEISTECQSKDIEGSNVHSTECQSKDIEGSNVQIDDKDVSLKIDDKDTSLKIDTNSFVNSTKINDFIAKNSELSSIPDNYNKISNTSCRIPKLSSNSFKFLSFHGKVFEIVKSELKLLVDVNMFIYSLVVFEKFLIISAGKTFIFNFYNKEILEVSENSNFSFKFKDKLFLCLSSNIKELSSFKSEFRFQFKNFELDITSSLLCSSKGFPITTEMSYTENKLKISYRKSILLFNNMFISCFTKIREDLLCVGLINKTGNINKNEKNSEINNCKNEKNSEINNCKNGKNSEINNCKLVFIIILDTKLKIRNEISLESFPLCICSFDNQICVILSSAVVLYQLKYGKIILKKKIKTVEICRKAQFITKSKVLIQNEDWSYSKINLKTGEVIKFASEGVAMPFVINKLEGHATGTKLIISGCELNCNDDISDVYSLNKLVLVFCRNGSIYLLQNREGENSRSIYDNTPTILSK